MRETRTSGSMSGERKRDDGQYAYSPKSPRLSSTLLRAQAGLAWRLRASKGLNTDEQV